MNEDGKEQGDRDLEGLVPFIKEEAKERIDSAETGNAQDAQESAFQKAQAAMEEDADSDPNSARLAVLITQSLEQDISERRVYAKKIFTMLSVWLSAVVAIIVLDGFNSKYRFVQFSVKMPEDVSVSGACIFSLFSVSENVILALIGSTTVSVIGLFVIVARYLFPRNAIDFVQINRDGFHGRRRARRRRTRK